MRHARTFVILTFTMGILAVVLVLYRSRDHIPAYPHTLSQEVYTDSAITTTRFRTEDPPAAVIAFYATVLPEYSWVLTDEITYGEEPDTAYIDVYARGDQGVMISAGPGMQGGITHGRVKEGRLEDLYTLLRWAR